MTQLKDFERELRLALGPLLDKKQQAEALAETAHEALDEAIKSGDASEKYTRYVNGDPNKTEEQVEPPGPIVYVFDYQSDIAKFALSWARANSPTQSGHYRDSWFCMVDGAQVEPDQVPEGATFVVTNDVPYSRKIEIGTQKVSVPPHIIERLQQAIHAAYPAVQTRVQYIELAGGYILKGTKRGARRGQQLMYPALEISQP